MIKFKLNSIIEAYNRKHLRDKLTITSLSRDTGVSRHSLQKLCGGKYRQSKGVTFDTLNRLVNFFGLPVDQFIEYQPDGLTLKLTNALDFLPPRFMSNHQTGTARSLIKNGIICKAQFDHHKSSAYMVISVKYFPKRHVFTVLFGNLEQSSNRFYTVFKNNLGDSTKSYLFARVIAHSGILTRDAVNHADKFVIVSALNFKTWLGTVKGLNADNILNPKSEIKNESDHTIIFDETSNRFKK